MDITSKVILANPIVGCSLNCEFCYAKKINEKENWVEDFTKPELLENYIDILTKYDSAVYMVTGYTDVSEWTKEMVNKILDVCKSNPQNQYLFLTKRPYDISFKSDADNIWFGVSVCKREDKSRIDTLKRLEFKHKFVAFEPILEPLGHLELEGIEWISIGREISDRESRVTPDVAWIENIILQTSKIPILMKSSLQQLVGPLYTQSLPKQLMDNINPEVTSDKYIDVVKTLS